MHQLEIHGASLNGRLTLRSGRQARVRIVAVPVGGFRKGQLDIIHEIQHCPVESESTGEDSPDNLDNLNNLKSTAAGCPIRVSGGRISTAEQLIRLSAKKMPHSVPVSINQS